MLRSSRPISEGDGPHTDSSLTEPAVLQHNHVTLPETGLLRHLTFQEYLAALKHPFLKLRSNMKD